ncbi:MAG: nuclear transport factor 2 family protein [Parvibaculum sp.]|nr:nuclear transport factor 2 family protein [Parvibaculum sp.]
MNLPPIVEKWRDAWQSLDPDHIVSLYAAGATHMSAVVVERMQRPDGTLRGTDEIHAYATAAAQRLKSFRADILDVISEEVPGGGRAAVEYWRIVNGDEEGRTRVMEVLEWRGDAITACRVFHV